MTRVQSLASLQKPFAEVLIDALRAGNRPARKPRASSHDGVGRDQLDMRLDDEPDEIDD